MTHTARRYVILEDDDQFDLKQGDIVVGFPYVYDPGHRNNPDGKITVLWRESDGYRPECNQYWYSLRRLRGRVPIEWDPESKSWRPAGARNRPCPAPSETDVRRRLPKQPDLQHRVEGLL